MGAGGRILPLTTRTSTFGTYTNERWKNLPLITRINKNTTNEEQGAGSGEWGVGGHLQNLRTCTGNLRTCTGNLRTCTGNPGTCTKNPGTCTKNPGTCTRNPGICTKNPGICTKNPGMVSGTQSSRSGAARLEPDTLGAHSLLPTPYLKVSGTFDLPFVFVRVVRGRISSNGAREQFGGGR
jgi:hypothetical protein